MNRSPVPAVIIGAGPAGLAVAACLRRRGVTFEIIEHADRVAPAWHRHYDRLHLHTPKQHSALPFRPFPPTYPTYPSRRELIDYFDAYADAFDIRPRFDEPVRTAEPDGDAWKTTTSSGQYRSRALVVATGLNRRPHRPSWEGMADFGGTVLHAADYRNGASFTGRRVLVVGFGNSGGEIAIDLAEHGATVGLCVRSPVNIVPRDILGIPLVSLTLKLQRLPTRILDAVSRPLQRLRIGNLAPYGLRRRDDGPATQIAHDARIPLIDIGTIKLIKQGVVQVHPGIRRFRPGGIEFVDGTAIDVDAVVLATGYTPDLRFLRGVPLPEGAADLPIRGEAGPIPRLYFTGFRVTNTGTLREIGIEARNIARAISDDPVVS